MYFSSAFKPESAAHRQSESGPGIKLRSVQNIISPARRYHTHAVLSTTVTKLGCQLRRDGDSNDSAHSARRRGSTTQAVGRRRSCPSTRAGPGCRCNEFDRCLTVRASLYQRAGCLSASVKPGTA
jgi:hypothetical protein